MTSNPITLDKEYQTRDGRPVRVHATDIWNTSELKSVLATYQIDDSTWATVEYYANGTFSLSGEHPLDLIEKPKVQKVKYVLINTSSGERMVFEATEGYFDG